MWIFPPRRYLCDREDTEWCLVLSEAVLHAPAAMFPVAGLVILSCFKPLIY
jgi:hypothetical protein